MEIWKDIPGYEGYYQASTYGRIKSLARTVKSKTAIHRVFNVPERILKTGKASNGYPTVNLHGEKAHKNWCVHVLVLRTFIGPPPDKHICLHVKPDKDNCRLDNLYYGTYLQNIQDMFRDNNITKETYKIRYKNNFAAHDRSRKKLRRLTIEDVKDIKNRITKGESNRSIGLLYGVDAGAIRAIKIKRTYTDVV